MRPTWLLVALLVVLPTSGAFVPERAEGIGPGTHLLVRIDGQNFSCTAGWIFRDATGALYLSTAGHCLLPSFRTSTHGPGADDAGAAVVRACIDRCTFGGQTGFLLTGTLVELGPVAYARQVSFGGGVGNDFGLIRIPVALEGLVRLGLPEFGEAGRVGDIGLGEDACWYGAGVVTGETYPTMARHGIGLTTSGTSWRFAGPSAQGDSGAAVATCGFRGQAQEAVGILTHLAGGMVAGTTMERGQQLAREAGLVVTPVLH